MSKPIVIELTKETVGYPKGARFGLASPAAADKLYPDHKIVSYQDGTPYEEPKSAGSSSSNKDKKD